ncbi:hypothetical protein FXW78_23565 [Rhodococcus opacus]|nr:hypothetical protein [Rhodococcus opacus]
MPHGALVPAPEVFLAINGLRGRGTSRHHQTEWTLRVEPITFPDVAVPLRAADGFRYDAAATAPARSRVLPLEQLVEQEVRPGDAIHFPWLSTRAYAALFEVIRQARSGRLRGLTVISASLRAELSLLVASGGVDKLITSFAATTYPAVRPNSILAQAVKDGSMVVEEWSILALIQRVLAGALGWPFVPAGTMDGTDLPAGFGPGTRSVVDPFDGTERSVMPALRPDVSLIHCPVADWDGNGVIFPLRRGPPYRLCRPEGRDTHGRSRRVPGGAASVGGPRAGARGPGSRCRAGAPGCTPRRLAGTGAVEGTSGYGEDYAFLAELGVCEPWRTRSPSASGGSTCRAAGDTSASSAESESNIWLPWISTSPGASTHSMTNRSLSRSVR